MDRSGPLTSGGITARSVGGKAREYTRLAEEGAFELWLDPRVFDTEYVKVSIADGFVTVFNGLVRISENALIHVVASRHSAISGNVLLPDNGSSDYWYLQLTRVVDGDKELVGVSGSHQGNQACITWRAFHNGSADVDGPVDASILPRAPRVSALGHRRFASLSRFRDALAGGITFRAAGRAARIVVEGQSASWQRIALVAAENLAARYYASRDDDGELTMRLPDGGYLAHGVREDGVEFIGDASAEHGGPVRITFRDRVPGQRTVTIRLRDGDARPAAGRYIDLRSHGAFGIHHRKISLQPTSDDGEVRIDGLLPRSYEVSVHSESARRPVGVLDAGAAEYFEFHCPSSGTVDITIAGGAAYGVDQINFHFWRLWWRLGDTGDWRELPVASTIESRGWRIGDLPIGRECVVVARSDDWVGLARFVVRDGEVVTLQIEPLELAHGRVVSGSARIPVSDANVTVDSGPWRNCLPPWGRMVTDADGEFCVAVPASMVPAATLVITKTGHRPAALACANAAGTPCVIVLE